MFFFVACDKENLSNPLDPKGNGVVNSTILSTQGAGNGTAVSDVSLPMNAFQKRGYLSVSGLSVSEEVLYNTGGARNESSSVAVRTHQVMRGTSGPNSPFYEGSINPHDGEINSVSGSIFTLFYEEHDWDLNFGTEKCHSFVYQELGYIDEFNVFHPFTDIQIKFGSYPDTYSFTTILSGFFNQLYNEESTNYYIPWSGTSNPNIKSCTATINVHDTGFEGTYTGNCIKYNYL